MANQGRIRKGKLKMECWSVGVAYSAEVASATKAGLNYWSTGLRLDIIRQQSHIPLHRYSKIYSTMDECKLGFAFLRMTVP
jgi:hypothetical protein